MIRIFIIGVFFCVSTFAAGEDPNIEKSSDPTETEATAKVVLPCPECEIPLIDAKKMLEPTARNMNALTMMYGASIRKITYQDIQAIMSSDKEFNAKKAERNKKQSEANTK